MVRGANGGPRSAEGKQRAGRNAFRHGIRSPAPVIPGLENERDWRHHRDGTIQSLAPEGHFETVLAERVAVLTWRLARVVRYETESIWASQEQIPGDVAFRHSMAELAQKTLSNEDVMQMVEHSISDRLLPKRETLDKIVRYEVSLHRQAIQTLRELEAMQARRRGEPTPLARLDVTGGPVG